MNLLIKFSNFKNKPYLGVYLTNEGTNVLASRIYEIFGTRLEVRGEILRREKYLFIQLIALDRKF